MAKRHLTSIVIICLSFIILAPSFASAAPTLTIKDISDSPDPFSPNGDGIEDKTTISATISASGFKTHPLRLIWQVSIRNSQGKLVRRFYHRKKIQNNSQIKVSQTWNGRNLRKRIVDDGIYTYRIDARIKKVKAKPGFGKVEVTGVPAPTLTIKDISDSPDPFSPNGDGIEDKTTISATISASGFKTHRPLRLIWQVSIRNSQGKLVRRFYHRKKIKNNSQIKVSQTWNGRNLRKRIVADGIYTYRIDARIKKVKAKAGFGEVEVKTAAELSVTVSPDFWKIGGVEVYSITTMSDPDKIVVTNNGEANATYSLCLVNPQGWTSSQTENGPDIYILNAAFSEKTEGIIWDETDHALSTTPLRSTFTRFAGDQTGVNTAPNEKRILWLQFKAPTASSITTEQDIEVIINAEIP